MLRQLSILCTSVLEITVAAEVFYGVLRLAACCKGRTWPYLLVVFADFSENDRCPGSTVLHLVITELSFFFLCFFLSFSSLLVMCSALPEGCVQQEASSAVQAVVVTHCTTDTEAVGYCCPCSVGSQKAEG